MRSLNDPSRLPSPVVWASHEGERVDRIVLESDAGLRAEVSSFGASLLRLWLPIDGGRELVNVVLGYDSFEGYRDDGFFVGVTAGRVANRISRGRFTLGGRDFQLETNDGIDHLHGGSQGFGKRVWKTQSTTPSSATFALESPDGDSGYPGALTATVTYALVDSSLRVTMNACTHLDTLVNMAHHSYINLEGEGDVRDHLLELSCDEWTPGNPRMVDGRTVPVEGTFLDFRTARRLGETFPTIEGAPPGFDHNLLIRGAENYAAVRSEEEPLRPVAIVHAPRSGRVMRLSSNQPCVQLYTGNYLDGKASWSGGRMAQYSGFCLETQACPNAVNIPAFRDQVLLPRSGRSSHTMVYEFSGPGMVGETGFSR